MNYLLDANVLSETRRARASPAVLAWLAATPPGEKYASVLTVGELRKGVELLRRRDRKQFEPLDAWLAETVADLRDRIVPVDVAVAQEWGRLNAASPLPAVDSLIAATALVRGWTVATRNVRDFERTGVAVVNPFEYGS